MTQMRFATCRAVFDAYPEIREKIRAAPTDQPPTAFLRALSSDCKFPDAVTFSAYLLPRREAVWWACRCIRTLWNDGKATTDFGAGLAVAEAWVYEPDDEHRHAALRIGVEGKTENPLTWLALAAGWSGGFLTSNPAKQVPVPHYMTARAARVAVMTSIPKVPSSERSARLQSCILDAVRLAESGL